MPKYFFSFRPNWPILLGGPGPLGLFGSNLSLVSLMVGRGFENGFKELFTKVDLSLRMLFSRFGM